MAYTLLWGRNSVKFAIFVGRRPHPSTEGDELAWRCIDWTSRPRLLYAKYPSSVQSVILKLPQSRTSYKIGVKWDIFGDSEVSEQWVTLSFAQTKF